MDELKRPVGVGERSAGLLVTPLYNPTQPLIRYEITDEVTLVDASCPCGSAFRRIADVEGRSDDVFRYGTTVVHPITYRSVLGRNRNIVEYQVVQTENGAHIRVLCARPVSGPGLSAALAAQLEKLGLREPVVSVEFVEGFERQSSGKLKRFVPLAGSRPES